MNLLPYFIAFVKQRTVDNRIRKPLPLVNAIRWRKTENIPNFWIERRYGVETAVLVLPVVEHSTFPSTGGLEQADIHRNRLTSATIQLLVGRPCAHLMCHSGQILPSNAPGGVQPMNET